MRRSVYAVCLMNVHGHPAVIMFNAGESGADRLVGGVIKPGESDRDGLNRKLRKYILRASASDACEWKVGEMLGQWWRPNFDDKIYPYLPPHVTRPKECIKLYQVALPSKCVFGVPPGTRLVAVPLFELVGQGGIYPPHIAALPSLVSRFNMAVYAMSTE
mmetsp:Transcript_81126/g.185773  ORF Transcript_81126/g.185773 Transcript_81126/m.185773 type:complete len:160 (+) Transcript_81126:116-595(+)